MTLVLVALLMVAMLTIVALVIDFGNVRVTRQENKLTTDAVAAAGLQSLAPDGIPRPWHAACAALGYLRANSPGVTVTYMDGDENEVVGDPCASPSDEVCGPNEEETWAWIRGVDGETVVDIRTGYLLPDADFPEDAGPYAGDNGVIAEGGCDQLAVIVGNQDPAFFGGIAGRSSYDTSGRSVGRVQIRRNPEGVPAFLMLERIACGVLWDSSGAQTTPTPTRGIRVLPASATDPGIIHVDSSGTGPGCNPTGPCNKGNYTVSAADSAAPKIVAEGSANGTPGIVAIHALNVGGAAACQVPPAHGVSPRPGMGDVVSRRPIDQKYNPDAAPTISNIHTAARGRATLTAATATAQGYTVVSDCGNNASITPAQAAATQVFVDCDHFRPAAVTFTAATTVVFRGRVSVSNGSQLFMPSATRVVIGGSSSESSLSVAGGGRFGVNSPVFENTEAATSAACDTRDGPGASPPGAWTQTSQMAIFGGSGDNKPAVSISGRAALCQTFVYLGGSLSQASYVRHAIDDGTYDPSCDEFTPCAATTGYSGAGFNVSGNSSYVRWSAPNQLATQPPANAAGTEDLALWTEGPSKSSVTSNGQMLVNGVFFLPNADVEVSAPSSPQPRDAQFISRTLGLLQGYFIMQPTPGNAVTIPFLAGVGMVR